MSLTIEKTKRYDRQLRLWGESGQIALENAHICLIGCDGVGSEIAKNLILPGIGHITVIDNSIVTTNDLSNNFFLLESDVGKSRSVATSRLLRELNDDVIVNYKDDSVKSLLYHNPELFREFTVVIACGLNNNDLIGLDRLLYPDNIPLLVCHSLGMIGSIRVIISEHFVFDSHPDNMKPDLRLDHILPALERFSDKQDFETMSHKDLSHCPWLIILVKYIRLYQNQFNKWPSSFQDRLTLKNMIQEGEEYYRNKSLILAKSGDNYRDKNNEDSILNDSLESFEEAIKAVPTSVSKTEIPKHIRDLICDSRAVNISRESRPFWILLAALRRFIKAYSVLPLRGDIPDMTSDTQRYVELQSIYRNKADSDSKILTQYVQEICQSFQIQISDDLSEINIQKFAKNCSNVRFISTLSLERELKTSPTYSDDIIYPESEELSCYLALRASVAFYTTESRWPGQLINNPNLDEQDIASLRRLLQQELTMGCARWRGAVVRDEFLQEMCRYRGNQLHSISALIGGIASQEVVKLITNQYNPLSQPMLYNGITQLTHLIDI